VSAPRFSLSGKPAWQQWAAMLAASLLLIVPLELLRLPAALLLGAMGGAILVAVHEGRPRVPLWPYVVAQGLIGCLVARTIGLPILKTMAQQWPLFLTGIGAVLVLSAGLGWLLARWKILPGTTAVWGSAPGAATVMILMAEAFGGDTRLVAFMQFLRVILVALVASLVARLWVAAPGGAVAPAVVWFPPLDPLPVTETVALAVLGAVIGVKSKLPAGALLLPMAAGIALSLGHALTITLPPWLMAGCYVLLGWVIGLRFTREIVRYAARMLPRILAAILALIALCGGLAWVLHRAAGTDMLTAYLATSPGGADSVAIIASAAHVDLPFVMAMQAARFLLVLLVGPTLARLVARRVGQGAADSG
jgi:membrane AbrB-like protein